MIGVTWVQTDTRLASVRLRGLIPGQVLHKRGLITKGLDVVVASKHNFSPKAVRRDAKLMVMDVCDDHFHTKHSAHYRECCELADVVTVNSWAMSLIVEKETGREPIVIDDPYEDQEIAPSSGEGVLWFGHSVNLYTLNPYMAMDYPLTIIDSSNWSPERLDWELKHCRAVFIPTGDKQAKSANRAIKAIRYGKFPVCGPLPAHAELGLGNKPILEVLDFAMNADTSDLVIALQDKIRDRFSPETVADKWWEVFTSTAGDRRSTGQPVPTTA